MQAKPKSFVERSRDFSKARKCDSFQDFIGHKEMAFVYPIPSGSCSQPELRRRPLDDDRTSSTASSFKYLRIPITVRETYASKLRKTFLSTERLHKLEQSMKSNFIKSQERPKWYVPRKIRYNTDSKVNTGITGIHAAKLKKTEQSDRSDTNSMKSKSDTSEKDCRIGKNKKSGIKLVPHICKHGSYVEIKFPSEEQKTTLQKNETLENFDLKFVINASDLFDSAKQLKEKLEHISSHRNDIKDDFSNDHYGSGDKQSPFQKENYSNVRDQETCQNLETSNADKVGCNTNKNVNPHNKRFNLIGKECMQTGISKESEENTGDNLQDYSTPNSPFQVNQLSSEESFEPNKMKSNSTSPYRIGVLEKYPSCERTSAPIEESKLLQNGVILTSRKYTKHDRSTTERKTPTKIPQPIGSVSVRKTLPLKTRSAFTCNKFINSEDSLTKTTQCGELGIKTLDSLCNIKLTPEKTLNTEYQFIEAIENSADIVKDQPEQPPVEVLEVKSAPNLIMDRIKETRPKVKTPVCICSKKRKSTTSLCRRIIHNILNVWQRQTSRDGEILWFHLIFFLAFICVFCYDFSNNFQLFYYCANVFWM